MNPLIASAAHEARRYGALRPRPELVRGVVIIQDKTGSVLGCTAEQPRQPAEYITLPRSRPAFPWFLPLAELAAAQEARL